MAKKRRAKEAAVEKPRLEIRFDSDVYQKMQDLADKSGISVNQLVNGVMRWAVANGHAGEGTFDEHGNLDVKKQVGCVFFGRTTKFRSQEERDWIEDEVGQDPGPVEKKGQGFFSLDFTERRVVKE